MKPPRLLPSTLDAAAGMLTFHEIIFGVPAVRVESVTWSQPKSTRTGLRGWLEDYCRLARG